MNWFLLLIFIIGAINCQNPNIENKEKGLIDWINDLLGLGTTEDPPKICPVCRCGIARTRRRIVGGQETQVNEYRWMTALFYNGRFQCGGSLLNTRYVLTAAHCVFGYWQDRFTVRFLEHDRSDDNETQTIDRNVTEIISNLWYNPITYDNDIALLKLDEMVDLNTNSDDEEIDDGLRPVCLPEIESSYTNYTGVVTGWGATEEGGFLSNVLLQVNVPIISNEECLQKYPYTITKNMLCAGLEEGGRDSCQGDSGGPLHVYKNATGQYQEVGIVSWGDGCARPDRPGVYTNVSRYIPWIKENTRDACYCT